MWKVDVEFVWWNVRALGQEAHIAERAGIDHRLECGAIDPFNFIFLFIDEIKQTRKGVTQIETPPAPMTDIELPAHLSVQLVCIEKVRVLPINRVTGRGVQTAFTHG
jgi:hypothetical protein